MYIKVFIAVAIIALVYAHFIEPKRLRCIRYSLDYPNLPDWLDKKRIALFSDLHVGPFFTAREVRRVVDEMMAERPDLIIFAGDLIEEKTKLQDEDFLQSIVHELSRLTAPLGCYACIGNHEPREEGGVAYAKRLLKSAGFTLLINEVEMHADVEVVGLNDRDEPKDVEFIGLNDRGKGVVDYSLLDGEAFKIILVHQPDVLPPHIKSGKLHAPCLITSGHSHNGQVTFFGKPIYLTGGGRKYPYGHYTFRADQHMIVSSGLNRPSAFALLCPTGIRHHRYLLDRQLGILICFHAGKTGFCKTTTCSIIRRSIRSGRLYLAVRC